MRRAMAIARKEWRHLSRTSLLYLVLTQPLIFCLVWGFSASLDVERVPLSVLDMARSPESRALVRELEGSGTFRVVERAASMAEVERSLESGEAGMALLVPARFGFRLGRGRSGMALVADGTDPNLANLGLSYGGRVMAEAVAGRGPLRERGAPPLAKSASIRVWYNPSLRSRDVLLLGAICFNLMWFLAYPAFALLREREAGTFGVLGSTPLSPVSLWFGTILPYLAVALWGTLVQVGLTVFAAGVPFRGEGWVLLLGLALFSLAYLNLGCSLPLLLSRTAHATAVRLLIVFVTMAAAGYLLPISSLPASVRWTAELLPLKHALVLLRALFQKGSGAAEVAGELAALAAFAAVSSLTALAAARRLLRSGAG